MNAIPRLMPIIFRAYHSRFYFDTNKQTQMPTRVHCLFSIRIVGRSDRCWRHAAFRHIIKSGRTEHKTVRPYYTLKRQLAANGYGKQAVQNNNSDDKCLAKQIIQTSTNAHTRNRETKIQAQINSLVFPSTYFDIIFKHVLEFWWTHRAPLIAQCIEDKKLGRNQ